MTEKFPLYIKPTIFLSAIIGIIFGIILAIPIVQLLVIFLFLVVGGIIIFVLKKNKFLNIFTQKDGIIIGAMSGLISVFAAAASFLPLILLFSLFTSAGGLITSFFSSFSAFFTLLILIFCTGFMNAILNVLSALLVLSVFDNFEKKNI